MTHPLQRRKLRSSRPATRPRSSSARSKPKNLVQATGLLKGNKLVKEAWDGRRTLAQNYTALGLTAKLNRSTGGAQSHKNGGKDGLIIQPDPYAKSSLKRKRDQTSVIGGDVNGEMAGIGEVKVVRDEKTGAIIKVIHNDTNNDINKNNENDNPLNDVLREYDLDSDQDSDSHTRQSHSIISRGRGIVPALEQEASKPQTKGPRKQSAREEEWISALLERHGDPAEIERSEPIKKKREETQRDEDAMYEAMARDRELNPRQQSSGQIRKKVRLFRQNCGSDLI